MRTGSFGRVRSTTSRAVMIFVRLAIGSRSSGRRRHNTSPLRTSNTSPARGGRRRSTWKASTPESRTSGSGGVRVNGPCSRGGGPIAGGGLAASGGVDGPDDPASAPNEKYAAAPTATGASRSAAITARPRGRRRRLRPPASRGARCDRRSRTGGGSWLLIGRRRAERAQDPEAEQRDKYQRHDHEYVDALLHRHDDREESKQADHRQAAHERHSAAHLIHRDTAVGVVVLVYAVRERPYQKQPEQESADVCEVGHSASALDHPLAEGW